MSKLALGLAFLLTLCTPSVALAAFPTHSDVFVAASGQYARRTTTNTGFATGASHKAAEGWVKFATLPAVNSTYTVIETGDDSTNNSGFGLSVKNVAGTYVGFMDVYNRAVTGTVSLGFTTGVWYHYAVTYDGTNFNWYVGTEGSADVLKESVAAGTITAQSATVGIGGRIINLTYGEYFDGKTTLNRVWATDPSLSTLNANRCTTLGATTNLAAEWTLDNVYTDNSGNSNTLSPGTGGNAPAFGTDVPSCATAVTPSIVGLIRALWWR